MKLSFIAFTLNGSRLALKLAGAMERQGDSCSVSLPPESAKTLQAEAYHSLAQWTEAHFSAADGLVFIGACGIAVRAVAPHIKDKFSDPAVVSMDEKGNFSIPLLSGHVGGANALARRLAGETAGIPVITTGTDVQGLFAVDEWAARQGLVIDGRAAAKKISSALLHGQAVSFQSDFPVIGPLPYGVITNSSPLGFCVTTLADKQPFQTTLRLIPKIIILGIGCRRGTREEDILEAVGKVLGRENISLQAIAETATIDLKADEPGLLAFCRRLGLRLHTYSAAELSEAEGDFSSSDFVKSVTGTDNVCERAAVRAGGALLIKKQADRGITVAVAAKPYAVSFKEEL